MDEQIVYEMPVDPEARVVELFDELRMLAGEVSPKFLANQMRQLMPYAVIHLPEIAKNNPGAPVKRGPGVMACIYCLMKREISAGRCSQVKAAQNLVARGIVIQSGDKPPVEYKDGRRLKRGSSAESETIRSIYQTVQRALKAEKPNKEQKAIIDACHSMAKSLGL